MSDEVIKGVVFEDGGATFLARIYGNAGTAITQATVSTIGCKVFDSLNTATPDTAILTPTITVSAVVFDTMQTDARWTEDSTGFNFAHAMPATAFPDGEKWYTVEYLFTPSSGAVFWLVYEVQAINVRTS